MSRIVPGGSVEKVWMHLLQAAFLSLAVLATNTWGQTQQVPPAPFSQLHVDAYFFQLIFRVATSAATGDFDGDGYDDVAFTRGVDTRIMVSLGSPAGFGPINPIGNVTTEPTWTDARIESGDLNGDGSLDLVVGFNTGLYSAGASRLSCLFGLGNGTFTQGFPLPTGNVLTGSSFAMGDLDGDGDMEVVFLDRNDPMASTMGIQTLTVFDWQGGASMQVVQSLPIASLPIIYGMSEGPVIGDVTGDGLADIVLERYPVYGVGIPGDVAILPGVAPLGFSATPILRPTNMLQASRRGPPSFWGTFWPPEVTDVDEDGLLDILLPWGFWFRQDPIGGVVHLGQPFPALPPGPLYVGGPSYPARNGILYFEDFTGDGVKDLVTYTTQSGWPVIYSVPNDDITLHFREGTGDGTWSPFRSTLVVSQTVHQFPLFANRPADVDGDGDLDIVFVGNIDGPASAQVFGPGNAAIDTFVGRFDNLLFSGGGCAPPGSSTLPVVTTPRAFTGNAAFTIQVDGGQAISMPGFLGLSSSQITPTLSCGAAIDLSPQAGFLLPAPLDATGHAQIPLPVPPASSLWGLQLALQWGGLAPGGGVALSHVRNIVVW